MKYSKLQYFFWLISGSEISVLKKCPNEYNRHANIGMMILITSLFASFTAFVAGATFVDTNYWGVLAFAVIWGLVIFTLDRSMVNSIKRKPDQAVENQPFWFYFAPRFALAFILAFFMSIPLDHIIFEERIERQMDANNQRDWLQRQAELNQGYNVEGRGAEVGQLKEEVASLDAALAGDCPLPEYQNAKAAYEECEPQVKPLEYQYDQRIKERKAHYAQLVSNRAAYNNSVPDSLRKPAEPELDRKWFELKADSDAAYKRWQDKRKECNAYYKKADSVYTAWKAGLIAERNEKDSIYEKRDSTLIADKDEILNKAEGYKEKMDSMQGFDTKFTTLFLMPDWGVQFLKWLIFLALLVIEILPTYLKLKTPISQYDWKLYEDDQTFADDVRSRIESNQEIAEETERYRKTKEIELNNSIMDKTAAIELQLAEESLREWERRARESMNRRMDDTDLST